MAGDAGVEAYLGQSPTWNLGYEGIRQLYDVVAGPIVRVV